MTRLTVITPLALLSILLAACSHSAAPSSDLASLDKAYQSGVLTAAEYAAKKAALEDQSATLAALDKAFAAGILTKDEYAAKKSALLAPKTSPQSPAEPQQLAQALPPQPPEPQPIQAAQQGAPQPAPQPAIEPAALPVPSAAPPPAPAPAPPPPKNAAPAPNADGHTYRMKQAQILDSQGYERPMVAFTLLIPFDWQSQGATTWNIKDSCNTIQTNFRASGPDGRAFEVFPAYSWAWADNPAYLRQAYAQKAQFGSHACDVMAPMSAADYVKRALPKIRPNAKLVAIEAAPKLLESLQKQAQQTEQAAAQYRLQQKVRPDAVRARIAYDLNGQTVEEWIFASTVTTGTYAAVLRSWSYQCQATLFAARAPKGQLDSSQKLFELISSTLRVDQQWQSRVTQGALKIQQIQAKGVADRAKIQAQTAEDIRQMQQQGYENRQRSQDQSFAQFDQVIRGVESYQNPATGQKVELDSSYGHAWVSGGGEYLLSDSPNFNPNAVSTQSWTEMQHVKP